MIVTDYVERHAALSPDVEALIFEDRVCTYKELQDRTYRLANGLANLGVGEGDHIAVLAQNCFEYLEIYFGVAKMGGVVAPLNYRLLPHDIADLIRYVDTNVLIYTSDCNQVVDAVMDKLTGIDHFISIGGSRPGAVDYNELLAQSSPIGPHHESHMDELFCLIFTGGTTGVPKGAMLTHRNFNNAVLASIIETGPARGDVHLRSAPLFHIGSLLPIFTHFVLGNTQVLTRRFEVPLVMDTIEKRKVTYLNWNSSLISRILNHPDVIEKKRDLSSLRVINIGGSSISQTLVKKLLKNFDCTVNCFAAQTEAAGLFAFISYNDHIHSHPERLASAGRPAVDMEFKVVNDEDEEAPRGTVGELVVRGESVMNGYWNMPKETDTALRNGWMHTGDLCKVDDDGFLYYVDRLKDMIKSGGENVYSKEVEDVLVDHPHVLEAAVIGIPDEVWGESVKAFIVAEEGSKITEKPLISFCKERLAGFKCPKHVEFVDELPKTVLGKWNKVALRERPG